MFAKQSKLCNFKKIVVIPTNSEKLFTKKETCIILKVKHVFWVYVSTYASLLSKELLFIYWIFIRQIGCQNIQQHQINFDF